MRILVTGASGFIGGHFAKAALAAGYRVRINARRAESVAALVAAGAECVQGDLADAALASELCRDVEVVVHCAGAVGAWGSYAFFHHGNVLLTQNIVAACLAQKVRRLVHLSSPSIYFDGQAHIGITEDWLPARFANAYGQTKYEAEQCVMAAAQAGLEVLALRPRFVTGAGDNSIFPRLIAMQQAGRLAILGAGNNQVDFTHVHNLNQALLSALSAGPQALGKAYNISNGQPLPLWDVINYVLKTLDFPPVTKRLPYALAYGAACVNEARHKLWAHSAEPKLTRLSVAVMAKDFSLNIDRARQALQYHPNASVWDALDEFCQSWRGA